MRTSRGAAALAALLLVAFAEPVAARSRGSDASAAEGRSAAAIPKSTAAATLAEEEKKAAFARELELKLTPAASRTEDALLMAGGELHTDETKLADTTAQQQKWRSAAAATQRLIKKAQKARAKAALKVSEDEETLKRATQLVDQARNQDDQEISHRARSEMDEGRGVAMQRPSGVLLADSKKLNSQSNLVLKHSKSTQAKALAALDLKMAQQLADRASSGMVAAKGYFTNAIHERKEATAAAEQAAADTVNAASVSLTMNENSPQLHQIENGEEQGPAALQDIIATDAQQVDRAEGQLGAARETLKDDQSHARELSAEIWQVQKKIDALHKEFRVAQGEVLEAAKAHVAATKRLEKASADALSSETEVNDMRAEEASKLQQELHDARHSQLRASSKYERANERMEGVNGQRTLLQVRVARLKLKLKEAQLARDKAVREAQVSHTLVHRMEHSVQEETQALKVARLQLASKGLYSQAAAPASAQSGERQQTIGDGGRARGARGRGDKYAEIAESLMPKQHFDAHEGDLHAALAEQKQKQAGVRQEQQRAIMSAKQEADSVAQAQLKVQQQLDRVNRLERSLDY